MIAGGVSGISRASISCEATATVHDRISGFRSGPGIAIPIAPLAIPDSTKQHIAGTWSSTNDLDSPDEYWWDEDSNQLLYQPDEIAELAVTIRRGSATVVPGRLLPVEICQTEHSTPIADRVQNGISHDDASTAGLDRLSFPRSDVPYEISDADLDELETVLSSLIGQKRIFPVTDLDDPSSELVLTTVVAARILVVERIDNELRVLLQPTVMSTPAAIVSRDLTLQPNRYVRRIALLR